MALTRDGKLKKRYVTLLALIPILGLSALVGLWMRGQIEGYDLSPEMLYAQEIEPAILQRIRRDLDFADSDEARLAFYDSSDAELFGGGAIHRSAYQAAVAAGDIDETVSYEQWVLAQYDAAGLEDIRLALRICEEPEVASAIAQVLAESQLDEDDEAALYFCPARARGWIENYALEHFARVDLAESWVDHLKILSDRAAEDAAL